MDPTLSFVVFIALILIVSFGGAYLPMTFRATDKQMHLMIAFSAGVFLGILMLILLPEALHESEEGGFDEMQVMYLVLAGFLVMFIVDFLFKHYKQSKCSCEECVDHHSHEVTSISAFVGLSIHACFDGLALAAAFVIGEEIGLMMLAAVCLHKAAEVFSLSSAFMLAGRKRRSAIYLTAFCLVTPVAAVASYLFLWEVGSGVAGLAFAFSAGVFMFVTMLHMIPEAFHRKSLDIRSLALLLLGLLLVACVVALMGGHAH
ncbi:MAG: ZIP family metal transporter [Methanomassiliicoccaceae archaeon]|nr:ZIP family metal transporter [Methanomassiliicoccaceae archaeon]